MLNKKYLNCVTQFKNVTYKLFVNIWIYINACCKSKERTKLYFKIGRSTKRFVFFESIYFVLTYLLYMCMFPACCFRQRTYVAQGLVNGVLNESLNHSCSQFECFSVRLWVLYRGYSPLFLESVYFSLLYPSLIFDMFLSLCVGGCGCVCVVLGFTSSYFKSYIFIICINKI